MKRTTLIAAAIAAALGAGAFAIAQEAKPMMDHSKMGGMMENMDPAMMHSMMKMMMGEPKGDQSPSSKAYAKANAAMHEAMNIEFSGNADVDFAKGMIAHHEGAIAMSKVVLEFGKDAEMKKLAEAIIAAQGPEIEQMKAWLAKNAK
jgi:uncharacterized protein (DUF305 family)